MNTKFYFLMILFLSCCLISFNAIAQTAAINYIDANGYPNIKAYYTYRDATGKEIRPNDYTWKPQDIIIKEAGKNMNHNPGSPFCADPNKKAFSAILVFDVSKSMRNGMLGEANPPPGQAKWEVAFRAMEHFIAALDPALTECAIIEFGQFANKRIGFTNNKNELFKIVTTEPSQALTTNYNAAFLRNRVNIDSKVVDDPTNSALYIAQFAKYKPVVIFLTDGNHNPSSLNGDGGPFLVGEASDLAKKRNVYVFVIKIGNEVLSGINSANLSTMASVETTPGESNIAMDVTDPNELIGFYDKVLRICGQIGYPAPCYAEWTSECQPEGPRTVELTFPNHSGLTASSSYPVNNNLLPNLVFSPARIDYKNINPNNPSDVKVRMTAKNNFVNFYTPDGYITSDSRFTVTDWGGTPPPFTLPKDSFRLITVRYNPTDSFCTSASLIFSDRVASSSCKGDLPLTGQFDQFVSDINMGNVIVNEKGDILFSDFFCNRSCNSMTVTGLNITTGDFKMFSYFGLLNFPIILKPGICISGTFRFSPSSQGPKSAKINLLTSSGILYSNIYGNGIGLPGLISVNPVILPHTDCRITRRDSIIYLKNTGPIKLNINPDSSGLVGADAGEFRYIPEPLPDSIPALDSIPVTISFIPKKNDGIAKQCSLHVKSDADSNNDYYIQIDAFADSSNYIPNSYTFDLGVVCLDSTIDTIVNLKNVGTKQLHITPVVVPSTMTLNSPFWDLTGGENIDLSVSFHPSKEGPIDTVIIFTEDLCNIQDTVRFIGTVHDPKVSNTLISVSSNVGVGYDETVTIINSSSSVGLKVDTIVFDDPQFVFLSSVPQLPWDIPPGDSIKVTFRYTPDTTEVIDTYLRMIGMPCHDVLIPLRGNPSQATVDIVIDTNHTGYIGQIVPIPVYFRNANKFAESGTSTIDFDVSFDASLLKQETQIYPDTVTAGIRKLTLKTIPVDSTNNNQQVATLNLKVTDGNVTRTPLTITNAASDKKNVVFNPDDGLFRLIESTLTLMTKNYEKSPGEEFDLEIWQKDAKNLNPEIQENIETELRFNASVLEAPNISDNTFNGERIVSLADIPVINDSNEIKLISFRFKPMLGNTDTTYLILQNCHSTKGKIKINTVDGKLTLKGICVDPNGTKRLFEVTNPASLEAVTPNPTNSITEVKYYLSENGETKIWITNIMGNVVLEIENEYANSGENSANFSTDGLTDGIYFIMMQTPTQLLKRKFTIIK
ncbi:MAG: T9SS type A sorting domain-containing protein [Bacteroidetes bacterium]|nr:MAG: T9SS type A sorting domain-containing protein [Bacteroidota bacterium]